MSYIHGICCYIINDLTDGYTNELLSGGTTNYSESGTTNSCIFSKSGTTNSWLFNRRIMNSIRIELKNIIKTYLS